MTAKTRKTLKNKLSFFSDKESDFLQETVPISTITVQLLGKIKLTYIV